MENVIKQGYLRKSFPSDRGLSGLLERIDPTKWFVLGVRDGVPYLEYYDKEMDVFSSEPINTFNLSTCRKLVYTHVRTAPLHKFSLELQDRVIELATPDRAKMLEWYDVLESTLSSLGILQKEDHEHVYSFCPAVVNFGASSRKHDETKPEDEEVFVTLADAQQQEKIKRKESLDKMGQSEPQNSSACGTSVCNVTEDSVSSDCSGSDFIDGDFWQKNKIEDRKEIVGAKNNLPTPAVRVSLRELNNNKSKKREANYLKKDEDLTTVGDAPAASGGGGSKGGDGGGDGGVSDCSVKTNDKKYLCSSGVESKGKSCDDGISIVCLTSECDKQSTEDSGCSANESCQGSSNQEQKDAKNENLYSDFPVPDQKMELSKKALETLSESLTSNDTCVKQKTSSSNWVTFDDNDDDGAYESIVNSVNHAIKSNPSFVRDKLRHSTGSSNISASENTINSVSDAQLRHSLHTTTDPPLPPRLDSLPPRNSTISGKMRESSQTSAALANGGLPISNSTPPLPPRRFDSVPERNSAPPPPLPSREASTRKSPAPPSLPKRNYSVRSVSDSEGATAAVTSTTRRHPHQLSMKMKLDRSDRAFNVVSLKQSQVEILQLEMAMKEMVVQLSQKDCHGLALVDVYGSVWIAGWNQKDHPRLHDKFHVGDLVKKVDSVTVFTAAMAYKFIKGSKDPSSIDIEVQRLPHAKVLAIRRTAEGENLGFKREGGTGEIIYVDPNGLAAKNGLSAKSPCIFSQSLCNWFITEINSRPVSLFFKELEIEHRLNAVGKEISLVVQPIDFVNEIKKGLKKMKNYKNYVVK